MVVRRIKDRWHNSTPDDESRQVLSEKTLHDQASALAFIQWRLALNGAINLHGEDFRYDTDQQRIAVISEFLAFQVQLVDRRCSEFLTDDEREILLVELCGKIADQMQENLIDIAGPGNYRPPFLKLLNERFEDYSQFEYRDGNPGYDLKRYLGLAILDILGEDQTNRWVIDQIIDLDAPEMIKQNIKSFDRLFGRTTGDLPQRPQ